MKMKNGAKKAISMVMVVAVLLGLLPISAFASEPEIPFDVIEKMPEGSEGAGEVLYQMVGADGLREGTATAENWVSSADGLVRVKEEISNKNLPENVFDITMTVETRAKTTTTITGGNVAVVLVVDMSDSMESVCANCLFPEADHVEDYYCADGTKLVAVKAQSEKEYSYSCRNASGKLGCQYYDLWGTLAEVQSRHTKKVLAGHTDFVQRLAAAKESATAFVNNLAAVSGNRYVSLVSYSSKPVNIEESSKEDAKIELGWVNVGTEAGKNEMLAAINGLEGKGNNTNTEAGMMMGQGLLANLPKGVNFEKTSMVLLTDGGPGGYVSFDNTLKLDQKLIDKWVGRGKSHMWLFPMQRGAEIIASGSSLYSICYGMGEDGFEWLTDFSTKAFDAGNTEALDKAFELISDEVNTGTSGSGAVQIPFGDHMIYDKTAEYNKNYDSAPGGSAAAYFDETTNSLYWDWTKSELSKVTEGDDANNVVITTYEMTYRVKLDTYSETFTARKYYPTNKKTTINYTVTVDKNGVANSEKGTLDFCVPFVGGLRPQVEYTYEFQQYNRITKQYDTVETSELMFGEIWSKVIVSSAQRAEFENKYAKANYKLETLTETLTLGPDSDKNVILVQYVQQPSTIVVNHWVVETDLNEQNEPAQKMVNDPVNIEGKYFGEYFDVTPLSPEDGYTLVTTVDFDGKTYKTDKYTEVPVKLAGNVVNLYYTADRRGTFDFTQKHYTYSMDWALKKDADGNQVWTETQSEDTLEATVGPVKLKQYDSFAATKSEALLDDGYIFDEERSSSLTGTLDGDKTLDLYYYKVNYKPEDADKGTLTVVHQYVAYKIVVGGDGFPEEVEDEARSEKVTDPAIDVYVGEVRSATPNTAHGDGKWEVTSKTEEYQKVTMKGDESNGNANTITIMYKSTENPTDERPEMPVTVKHVFEAYKYAVAGETSVPEVLPANSAVDEVAVDGAAPAVDGDAPAVDGAAPAVDGAAPANDADGTLVLVRDEDSDLDTVETTVNHRVGDIVNFNTMNFVDTDEHYSFIAQAPTSVEHTVVNGENVITFTYKKMPKLPEFAGIEIVHSYSTTRSFVDADGYVWRELTGQFPASISERHEASGENPGYKGEFVRVSPITSLDDSYPGIASEALGDGYDFDVSRKEYDKDLGKFKVYKQLVAEGEELSKYVIPYVRTLNELTPENQVTLQVYPVWVTTQNYVDADGKVQYGEFKSFTLGDTAWSPTEALYATQKYSVDPNAKELGFDNPGFVFSAEFTKNGIAGQEADALQGNEYVGFRMGEAGTTTTVYLIYVKNEENRGTQQDVSVFHNYKTTTYTMVGGVATPDVKTVTLGGVVTKLYPGQKFTPTVDKKGYEFDNPEVVTEHIVGNEPLVINLNYSKEDRSTLTPTELTIVHHYITYDWQGNVMAENADTTKVQGAYAEQKMTVAEKFPSGSNDGENPYQVSASMGQLEPGDVAEGDVLGGAIGGTVADEIGLDRGENGYVVTLDEGHNVVVLVYTKTVETRENSAVKVVHQYYQRAEADMTAPEGGELPLGSLVGRTETTFTRFEDGVWAGNEFSASLQETYGTDKNGAAMSYAFHSAQYNGEDTELTGGKIGPITLEKLVENTDPQTITITYVRNYKAPTPDPIPPVDPPPVNPPVDPGTGGGDDGGDDNDRPNVTPAPSTPPTDQPTTPPSGQPTPAPEVPVVPGGDDNTAPEDALTDITDEETPLGDMPAIVPPVDEEFVIVDEESPLGNLPQTGTKDQKGGGLMGLMGLSGLLAAGGAAFINRKKENKG